MTSPRLLLAPLVAVALLALSGCVYDAADPGPTVTVTTTPTPEQDTDSPAGSQVGDELTPLQAWDICFAHTSTQVQSDVTEWATFTADAVTEQSTGVYVVSIGNVRQDTASADFGTATCTVEGRAGGVIISDWAKDVG